jgi:hypothetical protein
MGVAYSGVAKLILAHELRSIYVQCSAHVLQVTLQDVKSSCLSKDILDMIQELTTFFRCYLFVKQGGLYGVWLCKVSWPATHFYRLSLRFWL